MLGFAAGSILAALIWETAGYHVVITLGFVLTLTGLGLILLAE
ncbi:MAG: hypothetical protein AAF557_10205 [Pseudomonadota bacterium]